jgi:hypothetical protein
MSVPTLKPNRYRVEAAASFARAARAKRQGEPESVSFWRNSGANWRALSDLSALRPLPEVRLVTVAEIAGVA